MRINKSLILLFTFFYIIVSGFGITANDLSVFSGGALNIFSTSALSMSAEAAASSDSLLILTPANGSVVSYDISSFMVNLPSGTSETIFTLDGKAIGKGEADGSFTLPEPLTLGKHTLVVSAVYDDGTGEKVSSQFTVAIIPESQTKDFEEYASLANTKIPYTDASRLSMRALGDKISYYITSDAGRGYVFKGVNETAGEVTVANSYAEIYAFTDKSTKTNGKFGLEFDFYISHQHDSNYMNVVPYDGSGNQYSTGNVIAAGKVNGIADKLSAGWHTFKGEIDLDSMTYCYRVDGDIVPNAQGELRTTKGAQGISYYRIGISTYKISATDNIAKNWALDNIKTHEIGAYYGADEILFEDSSDPSADSDGLVSADSAAVSRTTQKLVLKVNKKLLASSVTASNITVTAAGKNVPLTAPPVYDAAAKTITLILDNAQGITGNGESYVSLPESIEFADGTAVGTAAVNRFNLTPDGFLIKSVDFKCGTSDLFTSSQLDVNDIIKADITIQNVASSDATLTAVLVVKSGNKILSVTPKAITATANTPNYPANIQAPALTTKEKITASLIFVDDLKNALYIDSYDLI